MATNNKESSLHDVPAEQIEQIEHDDTLAIIRDLQTVDKTESSISTRVVWQVLRHCTIAPKSPESLLFTLDSDNQLRTLNTENWASIFHLVFRMTTDSSDKAQVLKEFATDKEVTKKGEAATPIDYRERIKAVINSNRLLIARIMRHAHWTSEVKYDATKTTIKLRFSLIGPVARVDDLTTKLNDPNTDDDDKKEALQDLERMFYVGRLNDVDKRVYSWARLRSWADEWHKERYPAKKDGNGDNKPAPSLDSAAITMRNAVEGAIAQGHKFNKTSEALQASQIASFVSLGAFIGVFTRNDDGSVSVDAKVLDDVVAKFNMDARAKAEKNAKDDAKDNGKAYRNAVLDLWRIKPEKIDAEINRLLKQYKALGVEVEDAKALRSEYDKQRTMIELVAQFDAETIDLASLDAQVKALDEHMTGDDLVKTLGAEMRGRYTFLALRDAGKEPLSTLAQGQFKPGSNEFKALVKACELLGSYTRAQIDEAVKTAAKAYSDTHKQAA